jgi:hypothetical protein
MEWAMLGWRDGILLLVASAAIYLVFMLLRLTQIGRQHRQSPVHANTPEEPLIDTVSPLRRRAEEELAPTVEEYVAEPEESSPAGPFAVSPPPTFEWDDVKTLFGEEEGAPVPETPPARPGGFGEHLAEHLARSEVEAEVQRMRTEMEHMRNEVEELRAARRVSPQYAEAMELAQRGYTAQDLADRLDISLGEAELVHALSRSDRKFDEGENHGAERFATGNNPLAGR